MIKGGPEPPCQNKGVLAEIKERTGRPCPRVELEEENVVPADVLKFVLDERLCSFAEGQFQDFTSDWSPLDRIEMRNRLADALHSPEVHRILRPQPAGVGPKKK